MRAVVAVAAGMLIVVSCSQQSETRQWLSDAAGFNVTPEMIDCAEDAMDDLLDDAERREWFAHDPQTITVEEVQELPDAIAVADRCRHLMG